MRESVGATQPWGNSLHDIIVATFDTVIPFLSTQWNAEASNNGCSKRVGVDCV